MVDISNSTARLTPMFQSFGGIHTLDAAAVTLAFWHLNRPVLKDCPASTCNMALLEVLPEK
jgi:hypothetical protein